MGVGLLPQPVPLLMDCQADGQQENPGLTRTRAYAPSATPTRQATTTATTASWTATRTLSKHALNAVRDALTSDDPDVVRAMAVRIGLNVSTRTVYEAARRDSLDADGQPTVFSFGQDRPWRILEAIRRRELGLSPETHICMGAIQTSASVSMRSPWREVPDAEA
jgi:hypothetical protein